MDPAALPSTPAFGKAGIARSRRSHDARQSPRRLDPVRARRRGAPADDAGDVRAVRATERGAVRDRRERDDEPGELDGHERLAEKHPAERGTRDRRGETEERRRGGREAADAVEPQDEGECRPEQAEVGEAAEVPRGE
jgi:hypothetical protein